MAEPSVGCRAENSPLGVPHESVRRATADAREQRQVRLCEFRFAVLETRQVPPQDEWLWICWGFAAR